MAVKERETTRNDGEKRRRAVATTTEVALGMERGGMNAGVMRDESLEGFLPKQRVLQKGEEMYTFLKV